MSQTATNDANSSSPAVPTLSQIWLLRRLVGNSVAEVIAEHFAASLLKWAISASYARWLTERDNSAAVKNLQHWQPARRLHCILIMTEAYHCSYDISWEWRSIAAWKLHPVDVVVVKSLCENYVSVLHDKITCHLVIFITITHCTRSTSVSGIRLLSWNVICLLYKVQIVTFVDNSFKVLKIFICFILYMIKML